MRQELMFLPALVVLLVFTWQGCSQNDLRRPGYDRVQGDWPAKTNAVVQNQTPKSNRPDKVVLKQSGVISWYGQEFAGRKTASGEIYDPEAMTAAHPNLPFGTRLKVTLKSSGKSVVVKVNDRGPFVAGRVLDLSQASAQKIGLAGVGEAEFENLGLESKE